MSITSEEMKRATDAAIERVSSPPRPGWSAEVKLGRRFAFASFHSRGECVGFLRALADELREPLSTVLLCCTLLELEEQWDGDLWCDRTPPELDAWGAVGDEANAQDEAARRLGGPVRWLDDREGYVLLAVAS